MTNAATRHPPKSVLKVFCEDTLIYLGAYEPRGREYLFWSGLMSKANQRARKLITGDHWFLEIS